MMNGPDASPNNAVRLPVQWREATEFQVALIPRPRPSSPKTANHQLPVLLERLSAQPATVPRAVDA
jgi:hypothetical protein